MIIQSIYICKSEGEIVKLVNLQPDQKFFYKTFLELDCANMTSMLAFNSNSIECLLSDNNKQYFNSEFPLIYKNRLIKKDGKGYYYHSAIGIALKNNQVRGVNLMIKYCVEYQNNYFSSYLFTSLLPSIINKGIDVFELLNSDIFTVTYDYDEWPGNHVNDAECLRGYSESFFHLRHKYRTVFPEEEFRRPIHGEETDETARVFKVKYSINLLNQVGFYMKYDSDTGEY